MPRFLTRFKNRRIAMIKVPANVITVRERIALRNELRQEVIINALEDKLPNTFTATVVSSQGETNNPSLGTAYGNAPTNNPNEQSYFFARMRRANIDEMEKPDPFLAKTRERARKLSNMHPLGVLLKSSDGKAPQIGEKWTCRYLTKDRKGIVLIQKIGVSQNFLALATKESPFQMQSTNFSDGIVGDYTQPLIGAQHPYPSPLRRQYVGSVAAYKGKLVENGKIPEGLLGKTNAGTKIIKDLVPGWNKLEKAYYDRFGFKLGYGAGIRSYQTQIDVKVRWTKKGLPNYAATPGTSNHGWGMAIDIKVRNAKGEKVEGHGKTHPGYDTVTYKWMMENASKFGFHNPSWARKTSRKGPYEPWHWEAIRGSNFIKKAQTTKTGEF